VDSRRLQRYKEGEQNISATVHGAKMMSRTNIRKIGQVLTIPGTAHTLEQFMRIKFPGAGHEHIRRFKEDVQLNKGDIVWIETPKNPMCDIEDIAVCTFFFFSNERAISPKAIQFAVF
jgi:hypothetical protein